jgi:hypothetical protein
MTRLPRSPGSTLVLRLNKETVHDFILLFMPPCGLHLTPLATWSLERSLLVFSTPGGLTSDDCRMDLPGPTTSVGSRTDYSVGPWDYPACATRHLKAWSARTTQE